MPANLIVIGGLPATGKTTVARVVAGALGAPYLRIDAIEQAIVDSTPLTQPLGPVGYLIGQAVATEQLRLGVDVVVECVNPLAVTRDAWVAAAATTGARTVEVELVCSDAEEHRRRVQTRVLDVPGLAPPSWQEIVEREYEPWSRPHLVLDTGTRSAAECAAAVIAVVRSTARCRPGSGG